MACLALVPVEQLLVLDRLTGGEGLLKTVNFGLARGRRGFWRFFG